MKKPALVTIDSLDDERAVLETAAGRVVLPRELLPRGAKEGDRLRLFLELDAAETAKARKEISALQKKLARDADDITEI